MSYCRELSYADRKKLMALINDFGSAKYWLADAVHQDPDTIDKRFQETDDAHQAILDFLYPDAKDYDEDPPTVNETDDGPERLPVKAADHSTTT